QIDGAERETRPPPELESRDSSSILRAAISLPSPRIAASLHFLFIGAIIEFRIRGRNQRLVWIATEHQPERNYLDLRLGAGLPDDIDRADGVCGLAVSAAPSFE